MGKKTKTEFLNKKQNGKSSTKNGKSGTKNSPNSGIKKSYVDCFYMCDKEITSVDLYDIIKNDTGIHIEIWADAGVIEIELGEKSSIDVETLQMFRSETDRAFLEKNDIKSIFSLKTDSEHMEMLKRIFSKVINQMGGFICSDSDDFTPIILK